MAGVGSNAPRVSKRSCPCIRHGGARGDGTGVSVRACLDTTQKCGLHQQQQDSRAGGVPALQQSGQHTIREIYQQVEMLREENVPVSLMWVPAEAGAEGFPLMMAAKAAARDAMKEGKSRERAEYQARSTRTRLALAGQRQQQRRIPPGVGRHAQRVDVALPGCHTRAIYDALDKREARILVQLRTGKCRLNGYLHGIELGRRTSVGVGRQGKRSSTFCFLLSACNPGSVGRI